MRAVRFSADDWMIELEMDLFAAEARERVERVQWRLSQRLLALGQRVIVEWGTWSRADRDGSRALTRDDLEAYAAVFEPPGVAELALYDVPLARARSARRRTSPGGRRRRPHARTRPVDAPWTGGAHEPGHDVGGPGRPLTQSAYRVEKVRPPSALCRMPPSDTAT